MTIAPTSFPATLSTARYALLRSFRADGGAADTPVWFAIDGDNLVFRTKRGPKTRRLAANPRVELQPCDYRGRPTDVAVVHGSARVLDGAAAEAANRTLHRRYGWQWNVIPMLKIPGVANVHRDLPLREKLRRAATRSLWPDSAIVAVAVDQDRRN